MIAGHAAVETIDGMLTALHKARAALVSEIPPRPGQNGGSRGHHAR
jgi:hypothetical protein